jgi:FMN-dependent NADH-azoreductase
LRPEDIVISRDVGIDPPPALTETWINAAHTPLEKRSSEMHEVLKLSDTLIDELERADLIVLGTPMYNFGMPAQLKAYIDQVVRFGRTFIFDLTHQKQPYQGLLSGQRMLVITPTGDGGYEKGGPRESINHLDAHLRTVFQFIGVTEIELIGVQYDEFQDDRNRRSMTVTQNAVIQRAAELANCKPVVHKQNVNPAKRDSAPPVTRSGILSLHSPFAPIGG